MVTELSRYNLGVAFFDFDREVISHQFSDNWWILVSRAHCCYSQLNLTSDRMWFLCRFRYVESGSYRNLIDSFCQHFHGKHRNKNTEPKQNKTYSMETFHRWRDISVGHRFIS